MKRGVPPTDLKARTGEFTPPGITADASANSRADVSARMGSSVSAAADASTTGCSGDGIGDRLAEGGGGRGTTHVGGEAVTPARQDGLDGREDCGSGGGFAQMLEHHRCTPDLADGVGNPTSRDVGGRPVYRFEQARKRALGIDVRARGDADGAGAGGAEVGQDVTEQVRP